MAIRYDSSYNSHVGHAWTNVRGAVAARGENTRALRDTRLHRVTALGINTRCFNDSLQYRAQFIASTIFSVITIRNVGEG